MALATHFGERLTLGERYSPGQSSDDLSSFAAFNLGGYFKITPNFQILFSAGTAWPGAGTRLVTWIFTGRWTQEKGAVNSRRPKSLGPPQEDSRVAPL